MLTGPQRVFAEGIVSGLNQTQAYRIAYPKTTGGKSDRQAASRMATNVDIVAEIERLTLLRDKAFVMERVEWLHRLLRIADKAEAKGNYQAAVRALREIGLAMKSWYAAPEELGANVTIVIQKAW